MKSFIHTLLRPFLLLALLGVSGSAVATTIARNDVLTVDGITYQCVEVSGTTYKLAVLKVTSASSHVTGGVVTIPATVVYGDKTCTVTQVGVWNGNNNLTTWSADITGVAFAAPEQIKIFSILALKGSGITTVEIPSGCDSVQVEAFRQATHLARFTVAAGNRHFAADADGVLYNKDMTELLAVPVAWDYMKTNSTNRYAIREGVKRIRNYAFQNPAAYGDGRRLNTLVLPASLERFDNGASPGPFSWTQISRIEVADGNQHFSEKDGFLLSKDGTKCYYVTRNHYWAYGKATELKIPDGVTELCSFACYNLPGSYTTLNLNQVETVDVNGVLNCYSFNQVVMGGKLTTVEGGINGGTHINDYEIDPQNPNYTVVDGVVYTKNLKHIVLFPIAKTGDWQIPEGVETIEENVFNRCWLTSITVPTTVTTFKKSMQNCPNLKKVIFASPSHITSLPDNNFTNSALEEITIPDQVTTFGTALRGCSELHKVVIPDGSQLRTIAGSAFTGTALETLAFEGSCDNLTTIGPSAFSGLTTLRQCYNLPPSITSIGAGAFNGCTLLDTLSFAAGSHLTTIGYQALRRTALRYISLPSGLTTLQQEAFADCDHLQTITLPAATNSVDPRAFSSCDSLTRIDVSSDNATYASLAGMLLDKTKTRLVVFPPGKGNSDFLLLPPSVTEIGDYAFYDASKLENLTLTKKVTRIGQRAFGLCPNLKSLTILSDDFIPGTSINQETNVETFDNGTNNSQHYNAFTQTTIYVRSNQLAHYAQDDFWKQFRTIGVSATAVHSDEGTATDEFIPVSEGTVDLIAANADEKVKSYVVPETVSLKVTRYTLNDAGARDEQTAEAQTYQVNLIGDYAFRTVPEAVHEVIVRHPMGYLGANAFYNDANSIRQVIFTADQPVGQLASSYFELKDANGNAIPEFRPEQNIFVKKSKVEDYKKAWTAYANRIDYKITSDGYKLFANRMRETNDSIATFSREFDVDFGDTDAQGRRLFWNDATDAPQVIAYVLLAKDAEGNDAVVWNQERQAYQVNMVSVLSSEGRDVAGLYIPAGTGVILKSMVYQADGTITGGLPEGYYYRIGERDQEGLRQTNNMFHAVTVADTALLRSTADDDETSLRWYVSGGLLWKVKAYFDYWTQKQSLKIPIHQAWFNMRNLSGDEVGTAKFNFSFASTGTATGINTIDAPADLHPQPGSWFTLQGQRISQPTHPGIYIHGSRKVVVK